MDDNKQLKEDLVMISTLFYQEKVNEAMQLFLPIIQKIIQIPDFSQWVSPLFDSIERKDYIMAADIFYHEMACNIEKKEGE